MPKHKFQENQLNTSRIESFPIGKPLGSRVKSIQNFSKMNESSQSWVVSHSAKCADSGTHSSIFYLEVVL